MKLVGVAIGFRIDNWTGCFELDANLQEKFTAKVVFGKDHLTPKKEDLLTFKSITGE